jgi:hypothetical protein
MDHGFRPGRPGSRHWEDDGPTVVPLDPFLDLDVVGGDELFWPVPRLTDQVFAARQELPEVEAVYNPLPNSMHAPWNIAAIRAGKHVLTEKPFASNAAEAQTVQRAAEDADLVVFEGFRTPIIPSSPACSR